MKKYLIMFCLAVAVALAPVSPANAKYHTGDRIVAAAIGGAMIGLVGAAMQNYRTVYVEQPTYTYVDPVPFIVHETVALWEPHHYRPAHHVRHHHHHRHH